ncbi:MAG: glycosyltransferase [Rhodospirillaceae bacterium]|nr:glycosyltransferase [Rhodospirillaceae bacterium]
MLKFSVVTACYNAAETVAATLESVRRQTYPSVEHIIIDGASTDATLSTVEQYRRDGLLVVSEPDDGIGDAMNKGWALATGDFVLFLHADDVLIGDRALEMASGHLAGGYDIVCFDVIKTSSANPAGNRCISRPDRLALRNRMEHQGICYRRDVLERTGPFDRAFRISMDYDHLLRAVRQGMRVGKVDEVLAVMAGGGISSRTDWPGLRRRLAEERQIHLRHARGAGERLAYRLFWLAYWPFKYLRSQL